MNRTKLVMLTLVGLTAAGCSVGEKGPYAAKKDTLATTTTPKDQAAWGVGQGEGPERREYPQIEVEYGLRHHIRVGDVVVNNGEIMSVTVPIRVASDAGEISRIQYQFMFFDDKGVPLRIQPDWRYLRLDSRRQEFISANSSDTAATWRLRIQLNK